MFYDYYFLLHHFSSTEHRPCPRNMRDGSEAKQVLLWSLNVALFVCQSQAVLPLVM